MISSTSANHLQFNQNSDVSLYDKTKTYSSISQFEDSLIQYGKEQTKVYSEKFKTQENDGKTSVEELKNQLKKEFSIYKLVSSEPSNVVDGQHLLYIDDNNLKKMANDSEYKAKIFDLLRRESASLGSSKINMGGEVVNFTMLGSIFSLSDSNESVGGIPYRGSATSASFSTTKTSNSLGSSNDWFKEFMEKLEEKRVEKMREEAQKEDAKLKNTYA
ncbi:MAG: hypothetical protein PHE60_09325 [Sulfurospirillaceae bacterium]|nr:hypothetical protein [Sulfurospirillaceae bacterium]